MLPKRRKVYTYYRASLDGVRSSEKSRRAAIVLMNDWMILGWWIGRIGDVVDCIGWK
jgi:hypothetical protein